MQTRTRLAAAAAVTVLALPAAAACASSGNASDAARSAAASLSANPQFQTDKNRLEANMRKDFHPTHPIKSAKSVVAETFPGANVQAIVVYAGKTFKPAVRHAGPARTEWEGQVVQYALQQGAQGVGTGPAHIPGVTSSASPAAKPSHT